MDDHVTAIEARIDRLLGATDPDPADESRHLSGLELALLEALQRYADPDRGNPMLADAAAWRDLAASAGAPEAAEETDRFVARLIEAEVTAWREQLPVEGDAEAWFRILADARGLDLEALTRRKMAPPLNAALPAVRERFLAAIEAAAPTDAQRKAWVTELVDRADVVLTGIDDVEPDRAEARIRRVTRDLEWHLRHVETKNPRARRRLRRKIRRLKAERQERDLQFRLEHRFGTRLVASFERAILLLIVLVLGILTAEWVFTLSDRTRHWLAVIDLGACLVFLTEFFVKLSMVRGKRRWFVRHFLIDFLPSIPFAFLLRWARALRFLRFLRVARYVRVAQPLIRVIRAFGFLTRGVDRIVRRYGTVLNTNIVLYPTRDERAAMERRREDMATRLRRLQARLNARWERLLTSVPRDLRPAVVKARVEGLHRALSSGLLHDRKARESLAPGARDLAADAVLGDLAALTPQQIEADMGQDFVARVARAVRLFSLPPIRWFPVVRKYVPRIGRGMNDAEVVTAGAHRTATELRRHHDRYFWFADLHGTVTPAQFVDRVGMAMVRGAKRPAFRLVVFGAVFLVVQAILDKTDTGFLVGVRDWLQNIVGDVLIVLGSVCFAILTAGWYLQRVAGQATDFFTQAARAQYLGLTEAIKGRYLERDAAIFSARVFVPEQIVRGETPSEGDRERFAKEVRRWLVRSQAGLLRATGFDPVDRAVWIYRDSLDGALFGLNDTHTTGQLLGNPALRSMRLQAERITKKDSKALARLDLERQKSLIRGPYLWFSLVCKSIEHGVARLLVDYNRHALPLGQLRQAAADEKAIYDDWLSAETTKDVDSEDLLYATNAFTVLHFLDLDEERDAQIEARFGPRVLARLRRDRRNLIRTVFGTYPLHKRPHGERVLNLYRVYNRWLAGGRALLIPFKLFANWLSYCAGFVRWLFHCMREVWRPRVVVDTEAVEGAEFRSALRKIHRMRGPIAELALRMRARFDPEYLGLRLPGAESSGLEDVGIDADLRFLQATPDLVREMERERQRAARDMVRLGRLFEGGLLARIGVPSSDLECQRAAAAAYVGDMHRVRRLLSAHEILSEVYERARREELRPRSFWPRPRLKAAFRRWWNAHGDDDGDDDGPAARTAAWRATVHNVEGARNALLAWGPDARAEGERALAGILRHAERVSEQLVTLRTVQTLSLVDILNYRTHVFELGDYAASGDDPGDSLKLA